MTEPVSAVTAPGIYDLPASVYHADPCPEPSLSCSIAKRLCLASPAHVRQEHPRLNPDAEQEECEAFDLGTAAHALFLEGKGGVAIIDAKDWRTTAAKEARETARRAGLTPILTKQWDHVQAMVAAIRQQLDQHDDGAAIFAGGGEPERTLIWQEPSGTWCRARLDWLRPHRSTWAIDDYKTTGGSASPDVWIRSMFAAGTDIQAAWYLRGLYVLTGYVGQFRFVVQELDPPYVLSVISLGPAALMLAEKKCLYALDHWERARQTNDWIGYPRQTCYAELPAWHEAAWLEKELR